MNNALIEAKRAPASLEQIDGKQALVRRSMIQFITNTCDAIDEALVRIPAILEKHGLSEYDSEALQRAILLDGFGAVQEAVLASTRNRLKGTGLFPQMVEKVAVQNLDYLPGEIRDEIEQAVGEVKNLNGDLDFPVELASLLFDSGTLRIPAKYRDEISPRYTLEVLDEDIKTMQKMREASALLAELQSRGVQIGDELRIPPAGGRPILCPGLIRHMANGTEYTDAELLGVLQGIELLH